ncbi:hypothetical protein B0H14DRAFT_2335465 [Mycena olivaceomarginata]|nr:hypothetical protein B0H14DRAFT_2335465 [Mycena olivaceomarginata]
MTDYSSQGKTFNVCDLTNCRTHYSYYTSLSRGTSAEGTVILQGFVANLITSGISGFLRQEFRELEMLNEITRLRYEGQLSEEVVGSDRIELLHSYQRYRGGNYDPEGIHDATCWRNGDEPRSIPVVKRSRWQLVGKDIPSHCVLRVPSRKQGLSMYGTSERSEYKPKPENGLKRKQSAKSINYSCSYDALFAILYYVWQSHAPKWTERFQNSTRYLKCLSVGFNNYKSKCDTLEAARDGIRRKKTERLPARTESSGT